MPTETSALSPTRPYLVRAIYEWLSDNQLTPYLLVNADAEGVDVPREHVKDGSITLNIAAYATHGLHIDNELVRFSARFNGVSQDLFVPMHAVMGLFAKENGQGLFFEADEYATVDRDETLPATQQAELPATSTPKKSPLRLL